MDLNFRRLLDTIAVIPRDRKISTSEILGRLKARGHAVTQRTLQRDLEALARYYGIQCDERSKPYGWSWRKNAGRISLPEMDWPEALSFYLLRHNLDGLLPASVQEHLQPFIREAEQKLKKTFPDAPLRRWPEKVLVAHAGQPLRSPNVLRAVRDTVTEALLAERQLEIHYRRRNDRELQKWSIHPLGLVQNGRIFYLAARVFDYVDTRMLALHRIERATMLTEKAEPPKGFSLESWAREALGFGGTGTLKLVAEFRDGAGVHLLESPLADNQVAEAVDKEGRHLRVKATVGNTSQLRWWLLGFGASVEVIEPPQLRKEIATRLQDAAARYNAVS